MDPLADDESNDDLEPDRPWPRLARAPEGKGKGHRSWRLWTRLGAIVAAIAIALAAGHRAITSAVWWLQGQPDYQVAFRSITLDPSAPAYIKGGDDALLQRVQRAARLPDHVRTLDTDLAALGRDLVLASPWIERVAAVQVRDYPNRVVVALAYRRPIARIENRSIFLDESGVVLPGDELDVSALPPLLWIRGYRGDTSAPRVGVALAPSDTPEMRALHAGLKLAAFVLRATPESAIGDHQIVSVDIAHGADWLSLQTDDGYRISWGEAPGLESPGRPKAESKWRALADLIATEPLSPERRQTHYLSVAGGKAEVRADSARPLLDATQN